MDGSVEEQIEVSREVRLRDLRPRPEPIVILARVVRAERHSYARASDGARRTRLSGWLTDGTATLRFTWWEPPDVPIEPGDVLRAGPVELREYRGRLELSFSRRTRVQPAGPAELVLAPIDAVPARPLAALREGDDDVRVDARVDVLESRQVHVRGSPRTVLYGRLRDASGTLDLVAWSSVPLTPGRAVRIAGAYVRAFRGRRELHLDDRSRVEPDPREPGADASPGGEGARPP